ncbi:MAG: ribonuclease III [Mangrovibacterium sp.]
MISRLFAPKVKLFSPERKEFYFFLKNLLGYKPKNLELYETAMTHKSVVKLNSQNQAINNERLEYLGDAILGSVVAEFLYNRFPVQDEGFLTQMRSKLVNRAFLTQLTQDIGLSKFIQSKINQKSNSSHIYGDAFEATIGALYLDQGYRRTKEFIIKRLIPTHINLNEVTNVNDNYKSQLIEWAQKEKKELKFNTNELPINETNKTGGFAATIMCEGIRIGRGKGSSKKEAQQEAAKAALAKIEEEATSGYKL